MITNQNKTREEAFLLLREILSETTNNAVDDIYEESLVYDELNLTEFDLQRIIKEISKKVEVDAISLAEMATEVEEIQTVGDLLDLIVDEKELG
jgi:hypothetical protein